MVGTRFTGTPINRVDGRQKITGTAQYAAEIVLGEMTYGYLVGSSSAGGRIHSLNTAAAERAPGVLLILTHENRGHLGKMPMSLFEGGTGGEARPPLADDRILHNGQYVAMIVAERLEQARYAASLLHIEYEDDKFAVSMEDAANSSYKPEQSMGEPLTFSRGNVPQALAAAEVQLDATYVTPNEHPCALEPHATVASWTGDELTVYNATQWVSGDQTVLASVFDMPADKSPRSLSVRRGYVRIEGGNGQPRHTHRACRQANSASGENCLKRRTGSDGCGPSLGNGAKNRACCAARWNHHGLEPHRHFSYFAAGRVPGAGKRRQPHALQHSQLFNHPRSGPAERDEAGLDACSGRSTRTVCAGKRNGRIGVSIGYGPHRVAHQK